MENFLLIILCVLVAAFGAYETTRCRHIHRIERRRRSTDR